ncbi:hypothetical protein TWF696_004734 [Orbilia brochopaga]|uniref:Uncharacterized protein n=1 Tax=Orbilia brochopaga TaxID=3140254 RepID=A0AAV9UYN9_9PEZI
MPLYSHSTRMRVFGDVNIDDLRGLENAIWYWKQCARNLENSATGPGNSIFDGQLDASLTMLKTGLGRFNGFCAELGLVENLVIEALSIRAAYYDPSEERRLRDLADNISANMLTIEDAVNHELYLRNTDREREREAMQMVSTLSNRASQLRAAGLIPNNSSNNNRNNRPHTSQRTTGGTSGSRSFTDITRRNNRHVRFAVPDSPPAARTSDILSDPRNYEDIPYEGYPGPATGQPFSHTHDQNWHPYESASTQRPTSVSSNSSAGPIRRPTTPYNDSNYGNVGQGRYYPVYQRSPYSRPQTPHNRRRSESSIHYVPTIVQPVPTTFVPVQGIMPIQTTLPVNSLPAGVIIHANPDDSSGSSGSSDTEMEYAEEYSHPFPQGDAWGSGY